MVIGLGWGWCTGVVHGGEQWNPWPYLAYFAFCLLYPCTSTRSPLFIILTGNKIYGLSIVSEPAAAFHPPFPPSLCRALTSLLGLSKNKESLQGREWVGTAHREYAEPQMWGSYVQCSSVILESHDNLTLPVLIALKALKKYAYSFPMWKMFRTFKKALRRFKFRFPRKDSFS